MERYPRYGVRVAREPKILTPEFEEFLNHTQKEQHFPELNFVGNWVEKVKLALGWGVGG